MDTRAISSQNFSVKGEDVGNERFPLVPMQMQFRGYSGTQCAHVNQDSSSKRNPELGARTWKDSPVLLLLSPPASSRPDAGNCMSVCRMNEPLAHTPRGPRFVVRMFTAEQMLSVKGGMLATGCSRLKTNLQ